MKHKTQTHKICIAIRDRIQNLFSELESGLSEREDSRAFGGMIQKRITTSWAKICSGLGFTALPLPGAKTIFDFACEVEGVKYGIDLKTKDLDKNRYSDGGVCAVGNLLKFMANDKGVFLIAEFGHTLSDPDSGIRDIEYIHVAPFHCLPASAYRIENLGTGQVRLNYSINQVWDEIEWDRTPKDFFDIFTELAIAHYERVGRDAATRMQSMIEFRKAGYAKFKFIR